MLVNKHIPLSRQVLSDVQASLVAFNLHECTLLHAASICIFLLFHSILIFLFLKIIIIYHRSRVPGTLDLCNLISLIELIKITGKEFSILVNSQLERLNVYIYNII